MARLAHNATAAWNRVCILPLGGYIALQYGSGVVKFRKVQVKPL
jgi:hypothetical protein